MEYFFYANRSWSEIDDLEPFIVKRYMNNNVFKIVFDDTSYEDFANSFNLRYIIEKNSKFQAFGIDGYFYNITLSGAIKEDKYPQYYPSLIFLVQYNMYKSYYSDKKFKEKVLNDIARGKDRKASNGAFGFNKHLYINNENGFIMPYRFKKANKKNQPLIVYLAGAGTIGHDNLRQLWEFLFYAGGNRVAKHDCNILIPQATRAWLDGDSENTIRNRYTHNCALLIKQLSKENDIDGKRIYIYGTSFGAGCVWNALLNSPDLYAAAVEAMGEHYHYKTLTDAEFEAIANIPIWMVHSSDDTIVKIDSDDYFYGKLKSLGANVKYTRWDKYGHKMSAKFYRKEPWVEWMFNQTKDCK